MRGGALIAFLEESRLNQFEKNATPWRFHEGCP